MANAATSSPGIPGTPHSAPRTPGSQGQRTPPGGAAAQPSPSRSDLGHRGQSVRAEAGAEPTSDNPRTFIWGTSIDVQGTKESAKAFFTDFKEDGNDTPLYIRLLEQAHSRQIYFVNLDCQHIDSFDHTLYDKLVQYPTETITIFDVVLTELYLEHFPDEADSQASMQVRTFNLTDTVVMRNLNPSDMDKLVSIKGMIIRSSSIMPDIQRAFFECLSCHATEEVDIMNGRIQEPSTCKVCRSGQCMELQHNRCVFKDKQLIRLQESPEDIPQGETPMTVNLCAFEDLVDVARPGDRVQVTGIFRAQPMRVKSTQRNMRSVYKTYIDVIHYKRAEKSRMGESREEMADLEEGHAQSVDLAEREARCRKLAEDPNIYKKLIDSFAPSIYEMDHVKLGLLCQLFGGRLQAGTSAGAGRFRGDVNVLLVGDPGVSKSQLLQYVHKIAPRGIYTSGKGSSAVGLTAYVTKDPETRELVLESGALVLSDRGICCIDEFDKMSDSTRAILHEAMEQQTISVAKAGIICSLNARTSILAAANPIQSRYNPQMSVVENMNLPPTLLSRFDLIYLMLDQPNPTSDRRLAKHLVALYGKEPPKQAETILSLQQFAEYVSYARHECRPTLTNDAVTGLIDGYVGMRKMSSNKNTISATPRQLESIIRLAEAHAKMRLSSTVESMDVDEAMKLLRVATQSAATDPRTGRIDMDLINTGRSASSRVRTQQLVGQLKELLSARLASGSVSFQNLQEMVAEQDKDVTQQDLQAALRQLADDDVIATTGHGHHMTIARARA